VPSTSALCSLGEGSGPAILWEDPHPKGKGEGEEARIRSWECQPLPQCCASYDVSSGAGVSADVNSRLSAARPREGGGQQGCGGGGPACGVPAVSPSQGTRRRGGSLASWEAISGGVQGSVGPSLQVNVNFSL